jgi:hypothetical protein
MIFFFILVCAFSGASCSSGQTSHADNVDSDTTRHVVLPQRKSAKSSDVLAVVNAVIEVERPGDSGDTDDSDDDEDISDSSMSEIEAMACITEVRGCLVVF